MHVARIRSGYTDKQGQRREYESRYLRRTYRDGTKVKHETLANLSGLPEAVVDSIEAALKGTALMPAAEAVTITRSLPHGHVAAVHAMAVKLGLPALLGPACPERDLALALVISRVVAPASKLSTLTWWADTTLGADLGAATGRAGRHLRRDGLAGSPPGRHREASSPPATWPGGEPARMALFDLSSSWVEGRCCPLAARGYSRDGKHGKLQIEYGLLTDPARPPGRGPGVPRQHRRPRPRSPDRGRGAGQVRAGQQMVMVGDRGMITSARIGALNQLEDGTQRPDATGGSPACAPRPSRSSWPTTAPCSCRCSTSRTWPRSPPRTSPASG